MADTRSYSQFPPTKAPHACEPVLPAAGVLPGQEAADPTVHEDGSNPAGVLRRVTPTTEHVGPRA